MKLNNKPFQLTYCTNIHPGEDWEETFTQLQSHLPAVKKQFSPKSPPQACNPSPATRNVCVKNIRRRGKCMKYELNKIGLQNLGYCFSENSPENPVNKRDFLNGFLPRDSASCLVPRDSCLLPLPRALYREFTYVRP